jgi:hypothetical protein
VIILYIFLFFVGCTIIGWIINRSGDKNPKSFATKLSMNHRLFGINQPLIDPVAKARQVNDGTKFGHRESD